MDRFCLVCQHFFVCLTVVLLALGVLVVPNQFLWAESGAPGGGDQPPGACDSNSCPTPISNGCPINNGNQPGCINTCCANRTDSCTCEFVGGSQCICPGAVAPP